MQIREIRVSRFFVPAHAYGQGRDDTNLHELQIRMRSQPARSLSSAFHPCNPRNPWSNRFDPASGAPVSASPCLRVFVTDCVPAALQSVVRSFGLARFAEIQARFREIVARFAEMDARFPEIRISPNLAKSRQISAILAKTQGGENFAPQIDSQSPPTLYLPLTEPSTK